MGTSVEAPARLQALRDTGLMDSAPEEAFDRLTRLAVTLLAVPTGLVSLVDDVRQFFKSSIGLGEPWRTRRQTPLSHSFCRLVVEGHGELVVTDARSDGRVAGNGAILDLGVAAYAGVPLVTKDDLVLGAFCAIAPEPRSWSARDLAILRELAASVMTEVELRTERRAFAEKSLFFASVLACMDDAVVVCDARGALRVVNPAATRLLREPAMVAGLGLASRPSPAGSGAPELGDEGPLVRALRGERVVQEEILSADGQYRTVSATPVRDEGGVICGAVGVARDTTAAHEAQEARMAAALDETVRRDEARFRSLVLASAQTVWTTDATGYTWEDSPSWRAVTGQTHEEFRGAGWYEAVHPEDRAHVRAAWLAAVERGAPYEVEFRLRRADGSMTPTISRAVPVRNADGSVREWVGTNTDVTEARRAQDEREQALADLRIAAAELQAAKERLEQRVAERTEELARKNAALEAAEREARQGNDAKSAFLARMSHEIRTPMNGVLGLATLLLETNLTPAQRESLETLRASGDSLLGILNGILDFSKIESGNMELEMRPFEVRATVKNTLDLFTAIASQKGIVLASSVDAAVPDAVVGDVTRVRQVLANLVGNAVKFTERGRVDVGVAAVTPAPRDRALVRFRIADTGIGITAEQQENLFLPFKQANESTTRLYGGTGLGLSIAKHLVELMSGTLEVESAPGLGTTFVVTVPFMPSPKDAVRTKEVAGFDADLGQRAPLRILLAEDNLVNQKVAAKMLELFGYRADVVRSGAEAIRAVAREAYDLVFMDVHMPDVDGIEATKTIRAAPSRFPRPRIVAMTASSFSEDRARCLEAGMDDFLSKPVSVTDLGHALRRAASDGEGSRPGNAAARIGGRRSGVDAAVLARLSALLGEGPEELPELIRRFLANARRGVADVEAGLALGDAKAVYLVAHTLTATAGLVGAEVLSELYAKLMEEALAGTGAEVAALAAAVRAELGTVERDFAGYLGTD